MFLFLNFIVCLVSFTLAVLYLTRRGLDFELAENKKLKVHAPNIQIVFSSTLILCVPLWKYNFFLSGSFWK